MAVIRRYGEFPAFFVPDRGEIVRVARSPAGPYLKAAVLSVWRADAGRIRVGFQYLEASPVTASGKGAEVGEKGNVYIHKDDRVPLIRRMPSPKGKGTAA